jgi:probable F420-dependent oxidoreductase
MRLGVALPQYGGSCEPARVGEFARAVEEMGYESVWVGDRLLTPTNPSDPYPTEPQPYPPEFTVAADPLVLWSAAAATTERVTLGSSTFTATWYNGPQLARALTTIDALSRGRLLVGIGTSWLRDEYTASTVDWDSRGRRLDELVEFLRRWWTDNPVEFHGEFIEVPESVVDLRPARPGGPPLYFGGFSPPALRRAGRLGDGWLGFEGMPAEYADGLWAQVRAAAESAGRDPGTLRRIARSNPYPDRTLDDLIRGLCELENAGWDEAFVDPIYSTGSTDAAIDRAAALHTLWSRR